MKKTLLLAAVLTLLCFSAAPNAAFALTCERHECAASFTTAICCKVPDQTSFCAEEAQCTGQGGHVVPGITPTATDVSDQLGGDSATQDAGANNTVTGLQNPLTASDVPSLLHTVLGAVVRIGSLILILALVYVGFQFVMAQGNEEKLRDARNSFMWTVIGGLILLGAEGISVAIQSTVEAI